MSPRLHLKNKVKVRASVRLVIASVAITAIVAICFIIYQTLIKTEDTLAGIEEGRLSNFTFRVPLIIDKSFIRSGEPMLDFHAAVVLQHEQLRALSNGGNLVNVKDPDIAFTKADGVSGIAHLIENYDPVKGTITAWLRFDTLSNTMNDTVYLYFSSTVPRQSVRHAAIPDMLKMRWHMDKELRADAGVFLSGKSNGTQVVNGMIGNARKFIAGQNDFISYNHHKGFVPEGSFTISLWIKPEKINRVQTLISTKDDMGGGFYLQLNEKLQPNFVITTQNDKEISTLHGKTEQLESGKWQHIAVVFEANSLQLQLYVDGIAEKTILLPALAKNSALGWAFARKHFDVESSLDAVIDEVQFYHQAKNSSWIASAYFNQANAPSLFSFGKVQSFEVSDLREQERSKKGMADSEEALSESMLNYYRNNEQIIEKKMLELKAKSANPEEIQARLDNIRRIAKEKDQN
ncbi:MAG: LamG-like jellyroll fold domain-containing protein [Flavobacteriales bacterium]